MIFCDILCYLENISLLFAPFNEVLWRVVIAMPHIKCIINGNVGIKENAVFGIRYRVAVRLNQANT